MNHASFRSFAALCLVGALLCLAPRLAAQPQNQRTPPHLGFAYPAGGKIGTTFTVSIGGQNLNGTTDAYINGTGISARVVSFDRPLTQKEFNDLREKLQELQQKRAAALGLPASEKRDSKGQEKKAEEKKSPDATSTAATASGTLANTTANATASTTPPVPAETTPAPKPTWTAEDDKAIAELKEKIAKRPNRQGNPALAETITLDVTIAPEVSVGTYELRLKNPAGLSNPIALQVGDLAEFTKPVVTATTNPPPKAKRDPSVRPNRPQNADAEITVPATVNGQIMPGEVDRYRFAATKGQHITVAVSARTLIPYLADAVPGWFQATIALYDPKGREVAYGDSFRFNPDPVVSYEIPEDGTYAMEIKDSIYRGREDFVYRIAIGELPFVTSLFPLGGRLVDNAHFDLTGWNLPATSITMNTKDKVPGTFLLSVRNRGQLSNTVRFALDDEPSIVRTGSSDGAHQAQTVTLPIVIDGRIAVSGQEDVFQFEGKAGQDIVAEVFASRLGSPLDSVLRLTDATGKQIAANDDNEDKGAGLMTHHADSRISATLPANGTYSLSLADTQQHGGPEYGYRLRVGPPRPDFELRVVPSSVNLRPGTHVPITVYALRRDGFEGDIMLSLQDAPPAFTLTGARIPAGQDKVQLTIAVPPSSRDAIVPLTLVGAATIQGKAVGRTAIPADDMMQAFAYHHLVTAHEWLVDIEGRPGPTCRVVSKVPVRIPLGGTTTLRLAANNARGASNVIVELVDAPAGLSVKKSSVSGDQVEITLACDPAKAKAGLSGNLIINAFSERATAAKAQRPARNPLGSVPAIPFEVIAKPVLPSSTTPAAANQKSARVGRLPVTGAP